MDRTHLTDEQLAAEAARESSDGPAFVALVDRFRQRVWRICYRLLGNEQDSSDAAQEVFVRLFFEREKFEGRSKYSTWVHAIAVRTCLSLAAAAAAAAATRACSPTRGGNRGSRVGRPSPKDFPWTS